MSNNKVGQGLPTISEQIMKKQINKSDELEDEQQNNNQPSTSTSNSPTKTITDNSVKLGNSFSLGPIGSYFNKVASRPSLPDYVSATSSMVANPLGPTIYGDNGQLLTNLAQLLPLASVAQLNNNNFPVGHRKVRDSGSLLVMIGFLSFLAYIIWEAIFIKQVDMNIIVHGHDSYGNICGRDNSIRPIEGINESGKNYSAQPYTKYTLINLLYNQSDRLMLVNPIMNETQERSLSTTNKQQQQRQQQNVTSALVPSGQLESRILYQYPKSLVALYNEQPQQQPDRQHQHESRQASPLVSTTKQNETTTSQLKHIRPRSNASRPRQYPFDPDDSSMAWNDEPESRHQELIYKTECVDHCPVDYIELIFYRCMPKNWRFALFPNAINVTRTFIDDIMADIGECYKELIYIFSLGLIMSLLLLILLRFLASLIIWSCLLTVVSLLIATTSYSWSNYYYLMMDINNQMQLHQTPTITSSTLRYSSDRLASSDRWLLGAIFLTFLTVIAITIILVMRKRILMVTMLFRESGKALADMPLLLIQPLFTYTLLMGAAVIWFLGFVCLQSVRQPVLDTRTGFVLFKAEPMYKLMKWYHVFAYLWVSHFALACQHFVIGSAVSKWYFSPQKYHLSSPIGSSISDLILYYLGSVALGSFLVAVFKVIRIVAKQIQMLVQHNCLTSPGRGDVASPNQLVSTGEPGNSPNLLTSNSTSCCGSCSYIWKCFIWFFDNIVMIINRDAYVEIAIHGHSFLTGAKQAFKILASNPLKLLAIKSFGSVLLVIAKICVVVSTVSLAFLLLEDKTDHLNYSWSPIIISGLYAYIVAHWFLSVYEMVIDALFICYCEDYERSKIQGIDSNQLTGSTLMSHLINSAAQLHLA